MTSLMKNKAKVYTLAGLFALYLVVSLYQIRSLSIEASANKLSAVSAETLPTKDSNAAKITDEMLANWLSENPTASEVIQASMMYVHLNSIHQDEGPRPQYAFDMPIVLDMMYRASVGDETKKPHLTCGPRAYAMRAILRWYGIYSHLVQVYTDNYEVPKTHRMLEVYNPQGRRWEVWDPDYGVTYVDRSSGMPVDILALVFSDIDRVVPVGISGKGWDETNTTLLKNNYFESVLFEQDIGAHQNAEIMVNSARFDLNKVFSTGLTFEEWAKQHYGHPRIIATSGDFGVNSHVRVSH